MNRETVKAWAGTIVTVAVVVASSFGYSLDEGAVSDIVCAAVLIAATAYGCWKNHNFTEAAQEGQKLTDEIKAARELSE